MSPSLPLSSGRHMRVCRTSRLIVCIFNPISRPKDSLFLIAVASVFGDVSIKLMLVALLSLGDPMVLRG